MNLKKILKEYSKYTAYNIVTIIIIFTLFILIYPHLSGIEFDASYEKIGEQKYINRISIDNGWNLNLGELSIAISDINFQRDKKNCYDFGVGGKTILIAEAARCEIGINLTKVATNNLPIHCDYFDRFGKMKIEWESHFPPKDCYFNIYYSHDGPAFAPFKISNTQTLKFLINED